MKFLCVVIQIFYLKITRLPCLSYVFKLCVNKNELLQLEHFYKKVCPD